MRRLVHITSKGSLGRSYGEKCDAILGDGGKEVKKIKQFQPNLVCVVDNGSQGDACYAFSEREMKSLLLPEDTRPKRWFVWDKIETYAE